MTKDELSRQECIVLTEHRSPLGVDAEGCTHYHDHLTQTAWVVVDGEIVHIEPDGQFDAWIDFVENEVGWDELHVDERGIGEILIDQLANANARCA